MRVKQDTIANVANLMDILHLESKKKTVCDVHAIAALNAIIGYRMNMNRSSLCACVPNTKNQTITVETGVSKCHRRLTDEKTKLSATYLK